MVVNDDTGDSFTCNGEVVEVVESFTYLGAQFDISSRTTAELRHRLTLARQTVKQAGTHLEIQKNIEWREVMTAAGNRCQLRLGGMGTNKERGRHRAGV